MDENVVDVVTFGRREASQGGGVCDQTLTHLLDGLAEDLSRADVPAHRKAQGGVVVLHLEAMLGWDISSSPGALAGRHPRGKSRLVLGLDHHGLVTVDAKAGGPGKLIDEHHDAPQPPQTSGVSLDVVDIGFDYKVCFGIAWTASVGRS